VGSWGNPAVPPPSKVGESPSNKVLLVLLVGGVKSGIFGGKCKSRFLGRGGGGVRYTNLERFKVCFSRKTGDYTVFFLLKASLGIA
jgi:hypothetical protein